MSDISKIGSIPHAAPDAHPTPHKKPQRQPDAVAPPTKPEPASRFTPTPAPQFSSWEPAAFNAHLMRAGGDVQPIHAEDPLKPIDKPDMSTMALGEEGGGPDMTTMALGEEGGGPDMTTMAVGEEGGGVQPIHAEDPLKPIDKPDMTTMAIGEEGGK